MNYAMFCEQLHNVSAGLLEKRKMQGDRGGAQELVSFEKIWWKLGKYVIC